MSIFPEKNRKGYTGRWINERRVDGRKVKTYHTTLEEAEGIVSEPPPREATLGDLEKMTEGKLWRDHKDALQSGQRWRTCLSILGRATPLANVRKMQLERLVEALRDNGRFGKRSPKTINRYLASVSAALRWAHEADLIAGMPAIPWQKEGPGKDVYLPEGLDDAYLKAIPEPDIRLCIRVLLHTGMRVSELLTLSSHQLHTEAIHLEDTKNGRARVIPIEPEMAEGLRGAIGRGMPTYRQLLKSCTSASKQLGLARTITPHALRHTVATRLTAKGVNALTVAKLLGHSSLATTRGYAHHEVDTLREAMGKIVQSNAEQTRMIGKRKEVETQGNGGGSPRYVICSPLRSHSATRPNQSSNKRLSKGEP